MVEQKKSWAELKPSPAKRTNVVAPIRNFLEREMKFPKDHPLPLVGCGLGEPTTANGFDLPTCITEALMEALQSGQNNGYTLSSGLPAAKAAIAQKFSDDNHPINPNHIFIEAGCTGALFHVIGAMCEEGDKLLVQTPGFPLFRPISENLNISLGFFKLLPEKNWEVDLVDLEAQIDSKTKAILVNNPSNPCGACWTREHQEAILAIAEKHKLPLICDEVYYGLAFDPERPFLSFGKLTTTVPIICCSGLSKTHCVPGWRLGWSIFYNYHGFFDRILDHMGKQSMILLHPCSLVQAALPRILAETPDSHFDNMNAKLKLSCELAFERFSKIPGLIPLRSSAAMYMMVRIDFNHFNSEISDDVAFCSKLLTEQNAFCLAGSCFFNKEGFFRITTCSKPETIEAFADRVAAFCDTHTKK